jgi:hypothetical protein
MHNSLTQKRVTGIDSAGFAQTDALPDGGVMDDACFTAGDGKKWDFRRKALTAGRWAEMKRRNEVMAQ